jgi:rhodanese-related sulfurtransferase
MVPELYKDGVANEGGFRDVTPAQVAALPRGACIVDVREPHEVMGELGHIRGAKLVPLATVGEVARGWNPAQAIILVCRSGGRSATAARQLVQMGFSRVMNVAGGMIAYNAAGLPVERTSPNGGR